MKIKSKNTEKMAFNKRRDYIEYAVRPMTTCNAPAIFTSIMNKMFHDCMDKSVIIYIDEYLALKMDMKVATGNWRRIFE